MRSKGFDGMACSIAGVLAAIGDRWGALILRDMSLGLSRYDEFRRSTEVTNLTLSDRLKHLEAQGLVERRRYQTNPERYEYRLTARGWEVVPVLVAMAELGDRWGVSGTDGPPLIFVNRHTGATVRSTLVDQETGSPLGLRDLSAAEGPGADDLVRWRLSRTAERAARHTMKGA
jgi:DNA-binding HxlR family transcriptional regulator